jgi:hypothetical protein
MSKNELAVLLALLSTVLMVRAQSVPEGWRARGSAPAEYEMRRSMDAAHDGKSGASITHKGAGGKDFGTLMQAIDAAEYRGKRISLRAWIRTTDAESAQLWARVDGATGSLALDNMDDRPIKGTTGWRDYELVLDVPETAAHLAFGVLLQGKGTVAFDTVRIGTAAPRAKSTALYTERELKSDEPFIPMKRVTKRPVNLDLEM